MADRIWFPPLVPEGSEGQVPFTVAGYPFWVNFSDLAAAFPGPAGVAGPQGLQGIQGLPGVQGLAGEDGLLGEPGPQGTPGVAGAVGPTGATGPQGLPGLPGAAGVAGATGAPGPAGAVGATGPAGAVGPGLKSFRATGVTNGSGLVTFDMSAAGFVAPPVVSSIPQAAAGSNFIEVRVVTLTATSCTLLCRLSATQILLGLTLLTLPTAAVGVTIHFSAFPIGSQV